MTNGERLKKALKIKGIKQAELGRLMGKSRQHVHGWCNKSDFSLNTLTDILEKINMTHAAFFSIERDEK